MLKYIQYILALHMPSTPAYGYFKIFWKHKNDGGACNG